MVGEDDSSLYKQAHFSGRLVWSEGRQLICAVVAYIHQVKQVKSRNDYVMTTAL